MYIKHNSFKIRIYEQYVTQLPALMSQYVDYCQCANNIRNDNEIDLSGFDFFFPTTLLPIGNLIIENSSATVIPPSDELVERYIETMTHPSSDGGTGTYVPIVRLSENRENSTESLDRVYQLQRNEPTLFGNESAFNYVVQELIDNIYNHSQFSLALIMGQKYQTKGFVDFCFFDNGITIPKTFEDSGMKFKPNEAIASAINGLSSIHQDRGFGLRTSARLCVQGLKGIIQVISGSGAVYYSNDETYHYSLSDPYRLNGTLITLRIPYPTESIDIYPYLE